MKKRLGEIAEIQAGYQFRGRVVPDPSSGVPVIQMKDFDPTHGIKASGMVTIRMENIPPACIARIGDVLFLARGHRLTATMIGPDVKGAIVSGYFFILRPKPDVAEPGFLAWYINQPTFQSQLRVVAKGTDTPLVAKTDIQDLTVELPPMNTQALIARLDNLSRRERCLLEAIANKPAALIRADPGRRTERPWTRKESEMNKPVNQDEINMVIWKACDTFRGAVDPSEYKNYILTMLFVKYLSDLWKERRAYYEDQYGGNRQRVERALSKERFIVPPDSDFDYLYSKREAPNIGELINIALENIERANITKLEGVFRNVDFNSESALGETRERNRRLKSLLEDFKNETLDLGDGRKKGNDIIGDVYEFLIGRFAAGAGKKAGEFYTPQEVSTLLARLVRPKRGDRVCDPACGSGSLLIRVAKEIKEPGEK